MNTLANRYGIRMHFFEPDDRFDEVWNNPEPYLAEQARLARNTQHRLVCSV